METIQALIQTDMEFIVNIIIISILLNNFVNAINSTGIEFIVQIQQLNK